MPSFKLSQIKNEAIASVREAKSGDERLSTPHEIMETLARDWNLADQLLVSGCERLGVPFVAKWEKCDAPLEVKRQLWGATHQDIMTVQYQDQECLVIGMAITFAAPSDSPRNRIMGDIAGREIEKGQIIPYGVNFRELFLVSADTIDWNR